LKERRRARATDGLKRPLTWRHASPETGPSRQPAMEFWTAFMNALGDHHHSSSSAHEVTVNLPGAGLEI